MTVFADTCKVGDTVLNTQSNRIGTVVRTGILKTHSIVVKYPGDNTGYAYFGTDSDKFIKQ